MDGSDRQLRFDISPGDPPDPLRAPKDEAHRRHEAGEPRLAIALALGVTESTLALWGIGSHEEADRHTLVAEAARLYTEEWLSTGQVGEQVGVSSATVGRWLKKAGVELRGRGDVHPDVLAEAARLYVEEQLTKEQVGERMGVTRQLVAKWLAKAGVETRPDAGRVARERARAKEAEAVRLYTEEWLSAEEVGERLGVSGRTIGRWLEKAGVETRGNVVDPALLAEAARLHDEEQLTQGQVAERMGVTRQTINEWLKLHKQQRIESMPDEARIREAVRLYTEEWLSTGQVGEQVGVSSATVGRWLKKAGVELRGRGDVHPDVLAEAARLYVEEQLTQEQVGERMGVTRQLVAKWLAQGGVEVRATGPRALADYNEAMRLLDEGLEVAEVADRVGVTKGTVERWISDYAPADP